MGRMKEFKVGKAFTLGLDEITFLKVECDRTGKKASYLINKWIREKMNMQVEEIRKITGPKGYCTKCSDYKEHVKHPDTTSWHCETCGKDQTDKIDGMITRSKY